MAGYHLFSTGEVLSAANVNDYLMKQTTMIFASASARTTALSGVLREGMVSYRTDAHILEVYNGTAWIPSDTQLTTKGDLAVYSTAPDRLAVGADGQTLVANSANASGLGWTSGNPIPNPVINSCMDIWQRGTSMAGSSTQFCADRWQAYRAVAGSTYSRQATADTTNLPNIQYCVRMSRDSGNTATNNIVLLTNFESANSIPFAGKQVTMSFYARKGANFSAASSLLNVEFDSGTGTDQNIISGYTGGLNMTASSTATLTTAWQRFSYTVTPAATTTQLGISLYWTPVGTAGAADYAEVTGVQVDVGPLALPIRRTGTTLQGELSACMRYGQELNLDSNYYGNFGCAGAFNTTTIYAQRVLPVPMRVAASSATFGAVGNFRLSSGATNIVVTSISLDTGATSQTNASFTVGVASGLTSNNYYLFQGNSSTSGKIFLNAEL